MIDYLLKANSEADMISAIGSYLNLYDQTFGWRGSIAFPTQVFSPPTDTGTKDAEGNELFTLNPLPFFYLWIGLSTEDDTLNALPNTIIVADRTAAIAGLPFVIYATLDATSLDTYSLSPVVFGSNYPFGAAELGA